MNPDPNGIGGEGRADALRAETPEASAEATHVRQTELFLVTVPVVKASGWQQFIVSAPNKVEALCVAAAGGGTFHEEELCVDALDFRNADATKWER